MVPNVAKTGTSFKGAALYYLHDKREAWETERMTADRVAWTQTRNLATEDTDLAWRIMAATAMDQDRLKREAGVKNTGRKSANHVYAYSLAWHPDEAKNLSKAEMVRAADESIRVLGAQGHQAMIICHRDEPHPHVHVVLNRVDPATGRMLGTSNDRVKLSQWSEAYERERGKIWCELRVENNAKRAKGAFIRASSPTPRSIEKDFDQARSADPSAAKRERDAAKSRAANLAADSAATSKRHRMEWDILSKLHRDRKSEIFRQSQAAGTRVRAEIKDQFRPQWRDLYREQGQARREFDKREQRIRGKLENVVAALRETALGEGDKRSFIATGFNFLTSKKARVDTMNKLHDRQRLELKAAERRDVDKAMGSIRASRSRLLSGGLKTFASERQALITRQTAEREALKIRWREESGRRSRAFDTVLRSAGARQNAKAAQTPDDKQQAEQRRRSFTGASEGRETRRGRVRSRKRTRKEE